MDMSINQPSENYTYTIYNAFNDSEFVTSDMAWISSIMPCGNCGADPTSYKIKKYAFIFGEHKALAALSKSIWWTMNVPEWDQLTTQVFLFIALLMALMSTFLVSSLIGMWVIFMWKYAAACWLYNLRTIARCTKKNQ